MSVYKITVGICCFKQKKWLYRCLRSLASQTLSHDEFEVIVVNDDPGVNIDDVTSRMSDDLNIRLINNATNVGLPRSLNTILENAKGRYFIRVDADDYISKHTLYVLSLFLDMNRQYQAVTCDYRVVNDVGTPIETRAYRDAPIACGVMMTYEALANVGFYNSEFKMREGHELMQRFQKKYSIFNMPFPFYRYRQHEENRTNDQDTLYVYDTMLERA